MKQNDFQSLCLYNAESNVILKAMEVPGDKLDLTQLEMYPSVVPDRGVSDQTMEVAVAKLNDLVDRNRSPSKKPWWNFW
jgi:hypothetical protein